MKKFILVLSGVILSMVTVVILSGVTLLSLVSNKEFTVPYGSFSTIAVDELADEIDRSSFQTSDLTEQITFRQGTINSLLYTSIISDFNPNYRAENCISVSCLYVESITNSEGELILGVSSIWVEIYDDKAFLNAVIEYQGFIDIETLLQVGFNAEFINDNIELKLDGISLGSLTLPDFLVEQIITVVRGELGSLINNSNDLVVDVDFDTPSISINSNDLQSQFPGVESFRFNDLQLIEGRILIDIIYDSDRS